MQGRGWNFFTFTVNEISLYSLESKNLTRSSENHIYLNAKSDLHVSEVIIFCRQ